MYATVDALVNKYAHVAYEEYLRRNGGEMAKAVGEAEKLNDNKQNFSNGAGGS